ncbi:MAG: SpoIID/LytB domain-containing protein [Acidimicrobiales bacterium]
MIRPSRLLHALLTACLAFSLLVVADAASPSPAGAVGITSLDFAGRGWGHGRGMGQYGALGYAINHNWSHTQIVDHFYGNTTMTATGQTDMTVALTWTGLPDMLVQQEKGELRVIAGGAQIVNPTPGTPRAARVRRVGANLFQVETATGCGGGWTTAGPPVAGPVSVQPTAEGDHWETLLQVCGGGGVRWYRGTVEAVDLGGSLKTVNRVALESYVRGVVPRESPASWGDLGDGKGIEALKAQAVAARSYALAERRESTYGAQTCDTTSCQVYWGRAQNFGGKFADMEATQTNTAVAATAAQIRTPNGQPDGTPARTEFSSSTGGYTAGGTFPAVADDGDSVAANPNHTWKASLPATYFQDKWPGRGKLVDLQIKSRNGLGADGGRVTSIDIVFENSTVKIGNSDPSQSTQGGEAVRGALALKSDWFTIVDRASFPYHVMTRNGSVYAFGGAAYHGGLPDVGVTTPAIDLAEGPGGYWILGLDGGVFSFGVPFHGSMGGQRLNKPVVGMGVTAAGNGYWEVASDGGIFSFGDADFFGSTGNIRLNQPIVGMAATPAGNGYWLVASDGGIFSFGDAPFFGSTGNIRLNKPIIGMAATPSGNGYWLVASDGGLFAFGDASFQGSLPGAGVNETAVEMVAEPDGRGYLLVTSAGRVYGFGSASSGGGPATYRASSPTVAAGRQR